MIRRVAVVALAVSVMSAQAPAPRPKFDAFDVATIKPVESEAKRGRFITMRGNNRFVGQDYTLKLLIAAAYSLNPKTISGGPDWMDQQHYDIAAVTPGEVRPNHDEQMSMLRSLLTERFKLSFHRESKEFSIYALEVIKGGPKLKPSAEAPDAPAAVLSTVYPGRIVLPARNATMGDVTSMMQRAMLDRPVVDRTGLTGRYDFDLEWAPDETQFGGEIPPAPADTPLAPLFVAIQEQLGLKLEATRGPVQGLIVDKAERPTAD
jgi:uncharacterized protein (TIGR03435 family)